jgi:YidC/Oxa1 family membrane protein insertase
MIVIAANVLQPLIDFSEAILEFFHNTIGVGWGTSIILMTITIRLAILPLTFRGVKGMQELQRLQPEMKKLQERYKDDKQRLQQETMKFYKEHGVNPLSSCMPILLQLPFFLALFYLLRQDFKLDACPGIDGYAESVGKNLADVTCTQFGQATQQSFDTGFLFIPDLTAAATGGVLVALIVLYVITQLGASLVSMVSADRTQRMIFLALPFVFVIFIISFPTGLIVYWITTNVWTVGQQLLVRRLYPKPEPLDLGEEVAKPARGKPVAATALTDGKGDASPPKAAGKPAKAATGAKSDGAKAKADGGAPKTPPRSPRKRKKRSGRRR